jgi:hypothetical protein
MAHCAVVIAGLVLVAKSQASDVVDRSRISKSDYSKFLTPSLNRVEHEHGPDVLSSHNYLAELGPATGGMQSSNMNGNYKPISHPTRPLTALTATREEPPISTKEFGPPKIADREEKQAAQKPSSNNYGPWAAVGKPIGLLLLSAVVSIGVGIFLAFRVVGAVLGARLRKGFGCVIAFKMIRARLRRLSAGRGGSQPTAFLVSSGGPGADMHMNVASGFGDNVIEMESEDSNIKYSTAAFDTGHPHKVNSSGIDWGTAVPSKNSPPLIKI